MNLATEFHPVPKPSKGAKVKKPMKRRQTPKARAKEFSPKVRRIVMERSGGLCELCQQRRIAHIHHCIFRSQGGGSELSNALGLCLPCHTVVHSSRAMRELAVDKAKELASGQTDSA